MYCAEPLDTLKQWAIELFGKVSEGGEARLPFSWDDPVWESGRMYRVESVRDQHLLAMTWPLPCLQADYLTKPQDYISHLVGHGNANSSDDLCLFVSLSCFIEFNMWDNMM